MDRGKQGAAGRGVPAGSLEARHRDDGELESLGGVNRHDPDDVLVFRHEIRFLRREGPPQGPRQRRRAGGEARSPGVGELPCERGGPCQVGRHPRAVRGRRRLQGVGVFQQAFERCGRPGQQGLRPQEVEAPRDTRGLFLEPAFQRRVPLFRDRGEAQALFLREAGKRGAEPPGQRQPVVWVRQGAKGLDEVEDLAAGKEALALLEDGGDAGGLEGLLQGGVVRAPRDEDGHVPPLQGPQGAPVLVPGGLPVQGGQLRHQAGGKPSPHGGLFLPFLRLGVLPVRLEQKGHGGRFEGVAAFPPWGVGRGGQGFVGHPEVFSQFVRPGGAEAVVHEPDQVLPHPVALVQEDVPPPASRCGRPDMPGKKGRLGVAKPVDGLLQVPHHEKPPPAGLRERPDEGVLERVGVLDLVHQDVVETPPVGRVRGDRFRRVADQVVEGQGASGGLGLLPPGPGDRRAPARRLPGGLLRL